ncbi:MAG: hypothetical protein ACPHCN_18005 [Mycobacterium sp.]
MPAFKSLIPDPVFISDTRADIVKCAALPPAYQAWRQLQVIRNMPRMGWDLPRGSMPGTWGIVGNGPGSHVPDGCDHVLAINGALELVPDASLWLVADALSPVNSWGKVLPEWLERNDEAVKRATLVARVAANADLVERAGAAHTYTPCTQEHRDIIPDWIAARMPSFVDAMQSLPGAMHICWWLGASRIKVSGCPQGVPVKRGEIPRYYAADGTPTPRGRMRRRIPMHGVHGLVQTTPEHLHAHTQADAVAWFLRRAGCQFEDHSGGLIYRYMEAV